MSGSTAKQKVLEAMEKLPADATLEDAIERRIHSGMLGRRELQSWQSVLGGLNKVRLRKFVRKRKETR